MFKKIGFLSFFLIALIAFTQAQKADSDHLEKTSLVKFNITGVILNNYTFQYEKILKKKMSLALSVRFMPYNSLPIKGLIRDALGNTNPDSYGVIDRFKVSNFSFTPEVRFYFGKGYGQGFYLAPFYRFAQFKSDDLLIYYQDKIVPNKLHEVNFKGNLTGNSIGVLAGTQWLIKNKFVIDLSIAGPHFGISSGDFTALTDYTLTQSDKDEIEKQINDLNIPLTKISYDYPTPNTARLKFNGPWGGVRFGLAVGIKF